MTQTPHPSLVKVSDTDLTVAEPEDDIRGYDVVDKHGDDIGKVDDMMIDTDERKVRFINVASGGFLGIGEKVFLLPVDAIAGIEDRKVQVDRERHQIAGGPTYDPEMVERPDYWENSYGYYGYGPFWGPGYIYPGYGRFPRAR
jgi:sporulation protein YlmC with PRC-barrel domain